MKILRTLGAVVVGYVLFAVASMLLISLLATGDGLVLTVLALAALAVIGLLSGWTAAAISGETRQLAGYIVAGLVAVATIANLAMQLGAEPVWYKVGTLVLTVPGIILATRRRGA